MKQQPSLWIKRLARRIIQNSVNINHAVIIFALLLNAKVAGRLGIFSLSRLPDWSSVCWKLMK